MSTGDERLAAPGVRAFTRGRSFLGHLPEVLHTAAFRLAVGFIGAFVASTLLLFGFIYWQTAVVQTRRVDLLLMHEARSIAADPPERIMQTVGTRLMNDLHRFTFAGVFAADGRLEAGNLARIPPGLAADGRAHGAIATLAEPEPGGSQPVRAVARTLPGGRLLVIARSMEPIEELRRVVLRALLLGVPPAIALALAAGVFLSLRALARVREVHETVERIMRGDLHERLPLPGGGDDFDRLAGSVNRMLDEIARLLDEIKGVGNDIAHDLKTPLSRVRAGLERSRDAAGSREALLGAIDRAIISLDQTLSIINALLRIGEIEAGRRRIGFAPVELAALLVEIAELYAPIAEERRIRLTVAVPPAPVSADGDRDLLLEALANLVGNAIKFTQEGGIVALSLEQREAGPLLLVRDNGPGIPPAEHEAVFRRFYRSDKSRHIDGSGLGLSLVAAIAKLHGFAIHLEDATPGCIFVLYCYPTAATTEQPPG